MIFGCGREYLDNIFDVSIRSTSLFTCKFIYFLCYLFSSLSAYLHAYIACDRWNAVRNPIKSKSNWPLCMSKKIIFFLFCMCVIFNVPLFWFSSLNEVVMIDDYSSIGVSIRRVCEISVNDMLVNIVLTTIDMVFYCLVPFVITTIFSAITIYEMHVANKKREGIHSSRQSLNTPIMRSSIILSKLNSNRRCMSLFKFF